MKPEISVVIPLYNKERYIRRTIDSVLHQTFQNFECIVMDSSTDGSSEQVSQCDDPRIVLVPFEKSTAAKARNQGVQRARSDFIAFLDADDEWQPDHLETLIQMKKKFPEAGVCSTPYVKLKSDGRPMVMIFAGIPCPPWEGYIPDYLRSCSRGDEPVHSSSCAVPRDIFNLMGGFPEDLKYGEDQFLWGKISLNYPVAYSWKGLTIYHTDALGRICDETHEVREHPFSSYLQKELDAGNIPHEKIRECQAYIRRKRHTEMFARLMNLNARNPSDDQRLTRSHSLPVTGNKQTQFQQAQGIINRLLSGFYESMVYDAGRRLLCRIYGYYDPGEDMYEVNRR